MSKRKWGEGKQCVACRVEFVAADGEPGRIYESDGGDFYHAPRCLPPVMVKWYESEQKQRSEKSNV